MRIGILEDEVANLVAEIVHQPAFLDGVNLVESACDVKAYSILRMAFLERGHSVVFFLWQQGELLGCEPALVAAAELYLVAIFLSLHTSHDRAEVGQFYLSDACELVFHLLLFGLYLLLVGKILPFAAAADAEMLAHRLLTNFAFLDEASHFGFAVFMFLFYYLQVYYVAWYTERDEDNLVVYVRDALALSGYGFYGDIFE